MNRTWLRIPVLVVAVVVALVSLMPGRSAAEIKFAVLPKLSSTELWTMFTPFADYLSREVGEKVSLVIPKDYDAFKTMMATGKAEIGFGNPLIYLKVKKGSNVELLALSAESKAGTKYRGIIIARKDSGIEKVQDLRGKKVVFVDKEAVGGYMSQMLLLNKAGLDVDKDFTTLPFAKKHDNVVIAVFNKEADAGGLREDELEKMKDKVDLSQVRIVGYTDYFPNWPVFVLSNLDKGKAARIKAALLKLKPGDPQTDRVLGTAKLAGFATVSEKDFDQLRLAAQLAGAL